MWVNLYEKALPNSTKKTFPGTQELPGYPLHEVIFDFSSPLEGFRWPQGGRRSVLLSCRRWPGEGRCTPATVLSCSMTYSVDLPPGWGRDKAILQEFIALAEVCSSHLEQQGSVGRRLGNMDISSFISTACPHYCRHPWLGPVISLCLTMTFPSCLASLKCCYLVKGKTSVRRHH